MRGMQGTRGMLLGFRGMLLFYYSGDVRKDSGECFRRFRGMFPKIMGNVEEDSEECSRGFQGI